MTVLENLELGAYLRRDKAGINKDYQMVFERFPILADRKTDGWYIIRRRQQMLAMAELCEPTEALFLDEPSMGLAPLLCRKFLI